jgi:hypothetical protein
MEPLERSCAFCGRKSTSGSGWFLLVENGWGDRLKILRWDNTVALQAGIHCVCTTSHVERLVAHWIGKGQLGSSLEGCESASPGDRKDVTSQGSSAIAPDGDVMRGLQLGEITVDRGALNRALRENPLAPDSMLRSLIRALDRCRTNGGQSTKQEYAESELVV